MNKIIEEETEVKYQNLDDLSYIDFGEDMIALYVKKQFEGDIKVWKDSEMDGREYICINYEIIYLDTIKEMF